MGQQISQTTGIKAYKTHFFEIFWLISAFWGQIFGYLMHFLRLIADFYFEQLFRVKKGRIGDLSTFDIFRLASLTDRIIKPCKSEL